MNRELITIIEQIAREKGIDKEVLFEALESALLSAFKKTMGVGTADNIRMELARQTGSFRVLAKKQVVAKVTDPKIELTLAEARALKPDAEIDEEIEQELEPREFGRIAAQTAKQVILQRVRDAEREGIYSEFVGKEGHIVRGVVHRIEKRNVIVEMGKAEGFLPEREQIPGERINPGDRIRAFVLEVKKTAKGPQITLSRTHPGFLARLFETEIPEIAEGIVQVKAAAREAGERAKVAVASTKRDVDPIGACVGLRGTRIQVISRELRGEKIDIVEWSPDPATFVARGLSPAKVASVTIQEGRSAEDGTAERSVLVLVPDNQLSLAIGKKGQNARLAAKLTGMRVDIKSESELEEERRREEEERTQGRAALEEFAGVGPQLVGKLIEEELYSPLRIVRAGLPRLLEISGVGEKKAERILAAAREWLAAHAPAPPAGEPVAGEAAAPVAEEAGVLPAGPQPEAAGPQP
ncbi:MAG: transcription termination/antitermination protein NusA [Candidatus Rokubacteria bacterium]|nr:transcription termination/antitermination protein NusA [Candidatus Rokubacteria bacterium]MBI2555349.1 transcription termination/antitermination protein NusA [Candidatus Rokubacteria bacterium]